LVEGIEITVENQPMSKKAVIQGDLGGDHIGEVLASRVFGIKNTFLVAVNEIDGFDGIPVKEPVRCDDPPGFDFYRAYFQPIENRENIGGIQIGESH